MSSGNPVQNTVAAVCYALSFCLLAVALCLVAIGFIPFRVDTIAEYKPWRNEQYAISAIASFSFLLSMLVWRIGRTRSVHSFGTTSGLIFAGVSVASSVVIWILSVFPFHYFIWIRTGRFFLGE